jgi:uncharacterized membrane protein YebE (DUF533 family)
MSTRPILGSDVYLALAAVGWADGQLTKAGAEAILRAAAEEGLGPKHLRILEDAVATRVEMGSIDWYAMSKADRLYVYAIAAWIAELDGEASDEAQRALDELGDALRLPDTPRQRAGEIMKAIATRGDRPERFDFPTLRRTLDTRLDAARALRFAHEE